MKAQPKSSGLKVLFVNSFSIWAASVAVDRALASNLASRGHEVRVIFCDGVQDNECNVYGGKWGGTEFKKNCGSCQKKSLEAWQGFTGVEKISNYLTFEAISAAKEFSSSLSLEQLKALEIDGLPIGRWANQSISNMNMLVDPEKVHSYATLLKSHVANLLVLREGYISALTAIRPDRVISNDSFYGMWALIERLCVERDIPFYNHWPAGRGRVAVSKDGPAMARDISKLWSETGGLKLSEKANSYVDEWLELQGRTGGKLSAKEKFPGLPSWNKVRLFSWLRGSAKYGCFVLAPNAGWDMAAIDKQVVFQDMNEFVSETISWFVKHPEHRLLVRQHPVETNRRIPRSDDTVVANVRRHFGSLPSNIFVDSSKSAAFEEITRFVSGVIVHTSTAGLEAVARGVPVITTGVSPYRGKGFSLDPSTKEEFFTLLGGLSDWSIGRDIHIEAARKFIYLLEKEYYFNLSVHEDNWTDGRAITSSDEESRVGHNDELDFLVNLIVSGKPTEKVADDLRCWS